MKKALILLICFLGLVFMNCIYDDINNDITIKIDNNSSFDLHISFYPNTFTDGKVGVTYKYNDVNVKKGESVSLIVKFRYTRKSTLFIEPVTFAPIPNRDIKKIIFSKMGTGELIKEVIRNYDDNSIISSGIKNYTFEITDELLTE